MKTIWIDIPDNLKDNIIFKVIIESKEFSLIENKLGVKFNIPTIMSGNKVIVRDLEIEDNKLKFTIEEIWQLKEINRWII